MVSPKRKKKNRKGRKVIFIEQKINYSIYGTCTYRKKWLFNIFGTLAYLYYLGGQSIYNLSTVVSLSYTMFKL